MTTLEIVFAEVARSYELLPSELKCNAIGVRPPNTISNARHTAWWILRFVRLPQRTYPELARELNVDHSTVIAGVQRISHAIHQGIDLGTRALSIALRLQESSPEWFKIPKLDTTVIKWQAESYQRRIDLKKEWWAKHGGQAKDRTQNSSRSSRTRELSRR